MPAPELIPDEHATAALRERLAKAEPLQSLLPAIQHAGESRCGVYLVGGAVRDLLLDAPSFDVDLAVEGDALGFARDLAAEVAGDARPHERFGTAVVVAGDVSIDIATTRTESYTEPGALPQVAAAGLADDLARRDLTINAIASSLKRDDLGATCDPFGGFADLRAGHIRVLHDASFIDDPTRLLRAVRYEARFAFSIEPHTLELAHAAIASGRVGTMDSARVRDELIDLLLEERVSRALERTHELGLDRALHPRLSADQLARELIDRLADDPLLARLAPLCTAMGRNELGAWMDRLKFSADQRDAVVESATEGVTLGARLSDGGDLALSELAELLRGKTEETLALAAAVSPPASERVSDYRQRVQPIRLEISGDDLLAAGIPEGPAVGRALRDVLAMKLDGTVVGREEELAAALRAAGRNGA
ncbi:MAG: hypothetical protein WDZ37_03420 [Solirubrobacterales bacterium]